MSSKYVLQKDIKADRNEAWRRATKDVVMIELAQEVIAKFGPHDVEAYALATRYHSYRGLAKPVLPQLVACVEIENLRGLAKGEVYRAIAQSERKICEELEARFGELPLRYDPLQKKLYSDGASAQDTTDSRESSAELDATMRLDQFACLLNVRNISTTDLARVIGRPDLKWQRLAKLKGDGLGGDKTPLPVDISADIVAGLQKIESGVKPSPVAHDTEKGREQTPSDAFHLSGPGGLNISIETRLNIQDLRLEDAQGNALIRDGVLHLPPLSLSPSQRDGLRRWVSDSIAQKIV